MSNDNKTELWAAFERLKNGKPVRTELGRKITPSSVEDEAGLGRSILRNNPDYQDIFDAVVDEKLKRAKELLKNKAADENENRSSVDKQVKELKSALIRSNAKNQEMQNKYNALIARNAELTQIIVSKRFSEAFLKNTSQEMADFATKVAQEMKNNRK